MCHAYLIFSHFIVNCVLNDSHWAFMKIPTYLPDKEATIPRVTSTHRIDGDTYRPVFATGRGSPPGYGRAMGEEDEDEEGVPTSIHHGAGQYDVLIV